MERNIAPFSANARGLHQHGVAKHAELQLGVGNRGQDLFAGGDLAQPVFPVRRFSPHCSFPEGQPSAHFDKQSFSALSENVGDSRYINHNKAVFSSGPHHVPTQLPIQFESEIASADSEEESDIDGREGGTETINKLETGRRQRENRPVSWRQPHKYASHVGWGLYGKNMGQAMEMEVDSVDQSRRERMAVPDPTAGQGQSAFDRYPSAGLPVSHSGSLHNDEASKPVHLKIMQALKQQSAAGGGDCGRSDHTVSGSFSNMQCLTTNQWPAREDNSNAAHKGRFSHCNEEEGRDMQVSIQGGDRRVPAVPNRLTTTSQPTRKKKQTKASLARSVVPEVHTATANINPVAPPPASLSATPPAIDRPHSCQHCAAAFVDSNNLKRHMAYIHPDKAQSLQAGSVSDGDGNGDDKGSKTNLGCDVCGRVFTRPSRLERHKLIHTGQRPFVCDVCDKAFTQAGNLKTHKMLHTGRKPHACDVCGKAFSDAGNLKKHQVIHTGDKPFVCDICNKAFVETGHLKRHKKIHTGQKPFICNVCGKAFIEAGTLRRHKVQTNHNPIICYVCNRTFLEEALLEEHKKVHTGEDRSGLIISEDLI